LDILYFLFRVPLWCGAENRNGTRCRKNSRGLLGGCGLEYHKWHRLKVILGIDRTPPGTQDVPSLHRSERWHKLGKELWSNRQGALATLVSLASIASTVIAGIALVAKR
jgi:hypothetical protein